MNKIMTLEDLYSFYSQQAVSTKFNVDTDHPAIAVTVPGRLTYEEDAQQIGLTPVVLNACHTGKNLNQSRISKEAMEDALPSFRNRPILGYIWKDEDGNPQFDSHNTHQTDDGVIVYDEQPIGHIRENSDVHLEYVEDEDKYRVIADGFIYNDYTDAVEILKRETQCDVSVELSVLDLSYQAEEKVLDINKFIFTGVTILGKDEDTGNEVNPGMEGSNITIFQTIDSSQTDSGVINIINENQGKEGDATVDDVNVNAQTTEEGSAVDTTPSAVRAYSVVVDGETHQFELTLGDIQFALNRLVNETYSETDDCYYDVEVYPESNNVVMYNWWNGVEGYRQSFESDDEGNYSLVGEREAVKRVWLTDAEQQQIDMDRQSKASLEAQLEEIKGQLATYQAAELSARKQELIASEDYAVLFNSSEDVQPILENIDNYTYEELEEKLNTLLLDYAKKQFAATKQEQKPVVSFAVNEKPIKKSPYGGLFKD